MILLARYDANGALGLMVNRRTKVPISRALREIDSAAGHAEPVFVGGPVELDTVFGLTRASGNNDGGTKVYGDIYLVSAKTALVKALGGDTGPNRFRVYIGYCGWGRVNWKTRYAAAAGTSSVKVMMRSLPANPPSFGPR